MITYNREFQVINTPEKAYVLGFIYSDGTIGKYANGYHIGICQHEDETYLMEKILDLFPFFGPIREHSNPGHIVMSCASKDLYEDLCKNGVFPQKSKENRFNLRFPKLPIELQSHFIRGYFDGDGSVYKQKVGNTKFEIGGTCFYMITDLIKILYDNKITVNLRCKYTGEGLRTMDFYVLYASSDVVSKQFAEYIYRDCGDLYMKRKHDKLLYIPEYHRMERLVCPHCNGTNTIRNGDRQQFHALMLRGYCKDCKKHFSITAPVSSNTDSGEDELLEG